MDMRGFLGLMVGLSIVGCAGTSAVEPEIEVARDLSPPPAEKMPAANHLEEGLKLYAQERFFEAAEAFGEAYRDGGSAPALFAEGQSLQKAGDCARALEVFERLLEVEPDPTYAVVVEDLMEACR
jgi:tetratricopeptide (TPR) repeat protein